MFLHISVFRPLEEILIYRCPPELVKEVSVGKRVIVPLKTQRATGLIIKILDHKEKIKDLEDIKPIIKIIDPYPVMDESLISLCKWASEYYLFPLGMVFKIALSCLPPAKPPYYPARIHSLLETIRGENRQIGLDAPSLTEDQKKAVEIIKGALSRDTFSVYLLHGVTGSGKTEVYIQAVDACNRSGKGAIVLVPEIAITSQLIARFIKRFGEKVAVIHSGLTKGERLSEWLRIKEGKAHILIGVRSAVFTPMDNVGLIVVDEEHESAYKQEEGFKYNARDVAIMRARMINATVILGSATPSLETLHNVHTGKYKYISLPQRINKKPLPPIQIVDLRKRKTDSLLTPELQEAIKKRLCNKEQVLLFLNRRGFSRFILCDDCGYVPPCPNCSVSLVYHKKERKVCCHYCEYKADPPDICPVCRGQNLKALGTGTERIEEELKNLFPDAKILRMDKDTTSKRHAHHFILTSMEKKEAQILIGTQMVTKGLDLPEITLAGVLLADNMLYLPDFRSAERTFQLITQVAGRTGRKDKPGEVIVQTFNPDHYSIAHASRYEFDRFYQFEKAYRKGAGYPPFKRLIRILLKGNRAESVVAGSALFKQLLDKYMDRTKIEVAGPVPAPFHKLRGKHRWHFLLKSQSTRYMRNQLKQVLQAFHMEGIRGVEVEIDVDPLHIL